MRSLSVLGALAIVGCFEDAPPLSEGTGTTDAEGPTAEGPTEAGSAPDSSADDPSADVTTNDPSSSDGATTNDTADTGIPVTCGDGLVNPEEECDDANLDNDDQCGMACRYLWLGTGADGPLDVVGVVYIDAIRSAIVSSAAANDDEIVVASAIEFAVGDEILIIQMTGGEAGMYETRRVVASDTTTGTLTVEPVLANSYVADIAGRPQAIRVPNYTDVTIAVGGLLTAHPWDGTTGGVVAMRATGELVVQDQGRIDANALGLRGGIAGAPAMGGGSGNEGAGGSGNAEGSGNGDCVLVSAAVETGGPGQFQPPFGGPAGAPAVSGFCVGAPGGIGGGEGDAGGAAFPGAPSESGASQGEGGQNATASLAALHIGGGGGGGDGGRGGVGAGGGGGGGGCNSHCNDDTEVNGLPGMPGEPGGIGGAGGQGGAGGGLVFVVAERIRFEDVVMSRGGDGLHGSRGGEGGVGGEGGAGGLNCGETVGGAGGGGNGAGGGDGGDGGGGGAGGTIVLAAYELDLGEMLVRAFGGDGGPQGEPGGGGDMGQPNGSTGPTGDGGLSGDPGADGRVIVRCPAPGCDVATDPVATVLPFPR